MVYPLPGDLTQPTQLSKIIINWRSCPWLCHKWSHGNQVESHEISPFIGSMLWIHTLSSSNLQSQFSFVKFPLKIIMVRPPNPGKSQYFTNLNLAAIKGDDFPFSLTHHLLVSVCLGCGWGCDQIYRPIFVAETPVPGLGQLPDLVILPQLVPQLRGTKVPRRQEFHPQNRWINGENSGSQRGAKFVFMDFWP